MSDLLIERPTVRQMIEFLGQFDPDAPLRIEDADTFQSIEIIHAEADHEGTIYLSGSYSEMVCRRWPF